MTTVRVHFDGQVFVPEGPVDLPKGQTFEMEVRELKGGEGMKEERRPLTYTMRNGIPVVNVPEGTPPLTTEMVRHLLEDDED